MSPAVFFYKNSSFAFSCVQDFFNIFAATAVITGFTSLACTGQRDTQRMQEMHLVLSVVLQLSGGLASAGHFCAHRPQEVQECYVWNHAGFRMFRGAVTGNFRDREIAGNCLLKNLPAKCGELLTVSTVWSSGSVLVNNGMLCNC